MYVVGIPWKTMFDGMYYKCTLVMTPLNFIIFTNGNSAHLKKGDVVEAEEEQK